MKQVDLKVDLKHLYRASAKDIAEVDVPAFRFLMIDGRGDPNTSPEYAQAIEALFSVAYTAKFMIKKGPQQIDYKVMPLEGLWWADDMSVFAANDKNDWNWTMLIMQPPFVADEVIGTAVDEVRRKKQPASLDKLRLEAFAEGRCAQVMHVGPFAEEGPTVQRLHAFINERTGLAGKHHEIYLSDIRRARPKNWKTIIRQPMHAG